RTLSSSIVSNRNRRQWLDAYRERGCCVNYQMALCRLQVIGVIKMLYLCLLDSLSNKGLNGFKEEF
ncbi:hypothetical protein, partial [Enterobacter kobei]|uniref:hypothetical protein n=1 Tax=Enterobacter kobei TaxID=208224 RepID=UPI001F1528C4